MSSAIEYSVFQRSTRPITSLYTFYCVVDVCTTQLGVFVHDCQTATSDTALTMWGYAVTSHRRCRYWKWSASWGCSVQEL